MTTVAEKDAQNARTSMHRRISDLLGITTLTVAVPTARKAELLLIAERWRTEALVKVFDTGTDDEFFALSKRRSPWNRTRQHVFALIGNDHDLMKEMMPLMDKYDKLSADITEVALIANEANTNRLIEMKAERVVLGCELSILYKEHLL